MANAHLVFGNVPGLAPVIKIIASETVAGGSVSGAAPNGTGFCRITAVDGAVYAAVGGAGSADPRVYIPEGGTSDVVVAPGQTVGLANA